MQPTNQLFTFDANGNLVLTGIQGLNGSWSIDANGNAVFTNLSVNGEFTYQGTTLENILAQQAQGIVRLATLVTSGATYDGTNPLLVGRMLCPSLDASRQYQVGYFARVDVGLTHPAFLQLTLRTEWDADPTFTTGTFLASYQIGARAATANDSGISLMFPFQLAQGGTDLHIAAYLTADIAGFALESDTGARIWLEDIGPKITYDEWDQSGGANPPTTHVKTYSASSSASFESNGTNRAGFDSGYCYQGYYSSTNGNQYSMIGFPFATIVSDLSGATITKTEVYLNNNHWYNNGGGTAIIGYHNQSSVSGNHAYSQVTPNVNSSSFSVGQAKWVTVSNTIGNAFKGGTAKGIALGQGPSTSATYYGSFAGNGQTGEPQLRITYTK